MALGAPSRSRIRRSEAPVALGRLAPPGAASRQAVAARWAAGGLRLRKRWPPETWLPGHHPSPDAQGVRVGQRVLARPLSLIPCKAVRLSIPSLWVRAPPVIASREGGTSTRRGLLRRARPGRPPGGGSASPPPPRTQ